jgi:hypothetical protein
MLAATFCWRREFSHQPCGLFITIDALNYRDEVNRRDEPDRAEPVPQLFEAPIA